MGVVVTRNRFIFKLNHVDFIQLRHFGRIAVSKTLRQGGFQGFPVPDVAPEIVW